METESTKLQSHRLPTLYEVLNQQTTTPVDLWSFYTYLSQFPHAINYLDFWIDIMAHLRLCKDYVKGIRESVLVWEEANRPSRIPKHDSGVSDNYRSSVSTSLLLEALMNDGVLDFQDSKRVSQFLQGQTDSPRLSQLMENWKRQSAMEDNDRLTEVLDDFLKQEMKESQQPRITTKQLLNNALQIVNMYLSSPQQSPKFLINVPEKIRLDAIHTVQVQQRHDPDVFESLKSVAFQFLEMDCFPKFLGCVALHNLHDDMTDHSSPLGEKTATTQRHTKSSLFSTYTILSRVFLGLLLLGIGFWIGYVLIFLNYSRGIRVVTIVPFFLGFYYVVCGIYQLDVVYALFGVTQNLVTNKDERDLELGYQRNSSKSSNVRRLPVIFRVLGGRGRLVKVRHPFVDRILKRRSVWCWFLILLGTAIFTVIFSCVPGHRL